jgi:hypothetical protein
MITSRFPRWPDRSAITAADLARYDAILGRQSLRGGWLWECRCAKCGSVYFTGSKPDELAEDYCAACVDQQALPPLLRPNRKSHHVR